MSEVFHAAAVSAWSGFLPVDALAAQPLDPALYARAVRAPETTVLVVEDADGTVTGFALVRQSLDTDAARDVGELHMFYAHPDVWGDGSARHLMSAAVAALRARGFRSATLWTAEANHRPRAFFRSRGWLPDGARRSKTRYGVTLTELRHRAQIAPSP